MQIFLSVHPDASLAIFWLIGGIVGAGLGFWCAASFWRVLSGRGSSAKSRIGTLAWYALWSILLGWMAFGSEASALAYWYGQEFSETFLSLGSNWFFIIPAIVFIAGGFGVWRATRKPLQKYLLTTPRMLWHMVRLPVLLFIVLLTIAGLFREPVLNRQSRAQETVVRIESQTITMDEVTGKDLPPKPAASEVNATVAGVDANDNGIRDDVELAIFKLHPDSARIRAAELQYAMTEQMFLTDVFDTQTWKAVAEQDDRAYQCLTVLSSDTNDLTTEVRDLVLNTSLRKEKFDLIAEFTTSFGLPDTHVCDVFPVNPQI